MDYDLWTVQFRNLYCPATMTLLDIRQNSGWGIGPSQGLYLYRITITTEQG
jgi:hypothetical protein